MCMFLIPHVSTHYLYLGGGISAKSHPCPKLQNVCEVGSHSIPYLELRIAPPCYLV
jgi:hypothetical protein